MSDDLARLSGRTRSGEALAMPDGPGPSPLAGLLEGLRGRADRMSQMTQRPFHTAGGIDQAAGGGVGLVGTVMMPGDVPGPLARLLSGVMKKKPYPSTMTPSEINKALDRLDLESTSLTDEFLAAGRGHEKFQDIIRAADPLARRADAVNGLQQRLRDEIARRLGPGAGRRF